MVNLVVLYNYTDMYKDWHHIEQQRILYSASAGVKICLANLAKDQNFL